MLVPDVKDIIHSVNAFGPVKVVVVDTFAQVMPGANENAGEDVGKAIAHCKVIHKHTGALVILVHHSGKDSTKGARGWSGLRAAADAEIEIVRSGDDRLATITKLKDGEDGAEFGFRLQTVVIGRRDGHDISSCVVNSITLAAKSMRKRDPKGVPLLVYRAMQGLASLANDGVVSVTELLDAAINQLPFDEGRGKRDTRRQDAFRAIKKLQNDGLLLVDGGNLRTAS